jgi:hypothetical protein
MRRTALRACIAVALIGVVAAGTVLALVIDTFRRYRLDASAPGEPSSTA